MTTLFYMILVNYNVELIYFIEKICFIFQALFRTAITILYSNLKKCKFVNFILKHSEILLHAIPKPFIIREYLLNQQYKSGNIKIRIPKHHKKNI
jgi:hypothetical protein